MTRVDTALGYSELVLTLREKTALGNYFNRTAYDEQVIEDVRSSLRRASTHKNQKINYSNVNIVREIGVPERRRNTPSDAIKDRVSASVIERWRLLDEIESRKEVLDKYLERTPEEEAQLEGLRERLRKKRRRAG